MAFRAGWIRGGGMAGIDKDVKASLRKPGPWNMIIGAFAECLPKADNRITVDECLTYSFGTPQSRVLLIWSDDERALLDHAPKEARAMIGLVKGKVVIYAPELGLGGLAIREMARAWARIPRVRC